MRGKVVRAAAYVAVSALGTTPMSRAVRDYRAALQARRPER